MSPSQLTFDPETGLAAPESSAIRETVAADWTQAFFDPDLPALNTESTSPAGQLIDALVAEIEAKNAELLYLASQFNPKVADGRWQDALGAVYFLTRKLDEPTVVSCQLRGLNGTVIPYGALAQSLEGYTLICTRSVTIDSSGTAESEFRVSENGPIDIAPHSVTSIITTVPGWDSIDNEAAGATGRDRESRAEFESRRAASVAANAHGSTGALYGTLADISGVLDVQVLENIGPDPVEKFGVTVPGHGITVCIYGGEDADIAAAIYNKKDNGCDTGGNTVITHSAVDFHGAQYEYRIMRPETVNFWIKVTLGAGSSLTTAQSEALQTALYQDFYGQNESTGNARIGLASTVYASRFYRAAMSVDGIQDIQSIQVALSAGTPASYAEFVTINGDQEPVTSTANISVLAGS